MINKAFLSLIIGAFFFSTAQSQIEDLNKDGQEFIKTGNYRAALDIYQYLDSLAPDNADLLFNLGLSYYHSIDKPASLIYFAKSKTLGYENPDIYYFLAKCYQFKYDYENALYYLERYKKEKKEGNYSNDLIVEDIENLIVQIEESHIQIKNRLSLNIKNLGDKINSASAEYVPIILKNGKTLIFTSRRSNTSTKKKDHGKLNFEDIYISNKDSIGNWSKPEKLTKLNSTGHDANVALNREGNILYIYKFNLANGGGIYSRQLKDNDEWGKPKLVEVINSPYWEGSLSVSKDEDIMIFSSDRPGGFGGSDLYMTIKKSDGNWADVINLGPNINTPFDEDAPYLHDDKKTLFFSSKGHDTGGGYDIFSSRLDSMNNWLPARNMGFPINTADDDIYFYLISDGSVGYFTSHRHSNYSNHSIGEKDLFEIRRPNSSAMQFVLKGKVYDSNNDEPVTCIVKLKNLLNDSIQEQIADINSGKFVFDMEFERFYQISVEVNDKEYFSKKIHFPYQADLFETLFDIPIPDISLYNLKLAELAFESDTLINRINREKKVKSPTILLTRKFSPNDEELKKLLESNNIPYTFRKKLLKQLQQDSLIDDFEFEGNEFEDVFGGDDPLLEKLDMLDGSQKNILSRAATNRLAVSQHENNIRLGDEKNFAQMELTVREKQLVQRFANLIAKQAPDSRLGTSDRLLYSNLDQNRKVLINKLIGSKIDIKSNLLQNLLESDSSYLSNLTTEQFEIFKEITNQNHAKNSLLVRDLTLVSDDRAWNKLAEISTSGFEVFERLVASGKLYTAKNYQPKANELIVLMDDRGIVTQIVSSDSSGNFEFRNLMPEKRYHVLVNDYAISLTGISKYKLLNLSVKVMDVDYYNFYDKSGEEVKRKIDRIIAYYNLKKEYENNQIKYWEDQLTYENLSDVKKNLIDYYSDYLSAIDNKDQNFEMRKEYANLYDNMSYDVRMEYNRLITRSAVILDNKNTNVHMKKDDSLFYESLSVNEKGYVHKLKLDRRQQQRIFDNFLLSRIGAEKWLEFAAIEPVNSKEKWIGIIGEIGNKTNPIFAHNVKIAILDSSNVLLAITETDSLGNFKFPSINKSSSYRLVINMHDQKSEITDYYLKDHKIIDAQIDFYNLLSAEEKRIVDRIIATMMAKESYSNDHLLRNEEKSFYDQLSEEEKNFIDRLKKHIFAQSVSGDTEHLLNDDHDKYYNSLSLLERDQINRLIIQTYYTDIVESDEIELLENDSKFYDKLDINEHLSLYNIKERRRTAKDIFEEKKMDIVDQAWIKVGTIDASPILTDNSFKIKGRIVLKADTNIVANDQQIILTTVNNKVVQKVNSDARGEFTFDNLTNKEVYNLLKVEKSSNSMFESKYKLLNLKLIYDNGKENKKEISVMDFALYDTLQMNTVHFNFDSYQLNSEAKGIIDKFYSKYIQDYKNQLILLEGHTDLVGDKNYNLLLSKKRNESVISYLKSIGIQQECLKAEYFGEEKPILNTSKATLKNRRVEINVVLK